MQDEASDEGARIPSMGECHRRRIDHSGKPLLEHHLRRPFGEDHGRYMAAPHEAFLAIPDELEPIGNVIRRQDEKRRAAGGLPG
jgi:hypothetical protein